MARSILLVVLAALILAAGCVSSPTAEVKTTSIPTTIPMTTVLTTVPTTVPTSLPTPVITTARITPPPTSPTPACSRPASGTSLLAETLSGSMYLTIDNQNDYDAVITLRTAAIPPESGQKVMSFYLREHDEYTTWNIETGDYTLWYKLGECWDASEKTFVVHKGARRFDDLLEYTYDTEGYVAKIYGVVDGNAPTTSVPADLV